MRLYDDIELIEEIEELSKKEIHKGCFGTIVNIDGDIYTICFFNPKNKGEYAFAKVNKKYISFVIRPVEYIIRETEEFVARVNPEEHTHFTKCDVKEYDIVELLVEKPRYAKEGVHKGAIGTVIQPYAIQNRWGIAFSQVRGDWIEDVEINVDRKDFKIIGQC